MRLGVPFIALRQLGVIGALFGRQFLLLFVGATDCPMAHRTVNSTSTRHDRESLDWLVSCSMGHQTVWCGAPDRPMLHVTVGARRRGR
jgi:hypothetical protein